MADIETYNCESICPKCGAHDIEWDLFSCDPEPHQEAECLECGCKFKEFYRYNSTIWRTDDDNG